MADGSSAGAVQDPVSRCALDCECISDGVPFNWSADAQSTAGQPLGRSANGVLMAEPEAFWYTRLTPSRGLRAIWSRLLPDGFGPASIYRERRADDPEVLDRGPFGGATPIRSRGSGTRWWLPKSRACVNQQRGFLRLRKEEPTG